MEIFLWLRFPVEAATKESIKETVIWVPLHSAHVNTVKRLCANIYWLHIM